MRFRNEVFIWTVSIILVALIATAAYYGGFKGIDADSIGIVLEAISEIEIDD